MPTTTASEPKIDAKQAAIAAEHYFRQLFSPPFATDVDLEEIEMADNGRVWLVTLGFTQSLRKRDDLPKFLQVPTRKYKLFKVDARTGKVLAMKIPPIG